eukprot:Opistho-2@26759
MRDRLKDLKNAATTAPEGDTVIDTGAADDGGEQFMASFFQTVAETRANITEIEKKIKLISEKHGQALAAISEKQGQKNNEEMDRLMEETQVLANRVRNKLKSIDKENKELSSKSGGHSKSADMRIRESQHAILSKKFVEVMTEYNEIQTNYKQKYRDRVKRQFKIVKPDATADEVEKVLEGEGGNIFAQQILSTSHAEAKQALEDIQDRHKDILKLEKSIKELHELFLDMAILVESQGEMIDRIEFSVSEAADFVEEATQELKSAQHYQSSARRKKICIVIVILAIILVIILALVILKK